MPNLKSVLIDRVPFCISPYRISVREPLRHVDGVSSTYQIELGNADTGSIWGFDLSKYVETSGPLTFISPISISWSAMEPVVIFDSDLHGYHGELNASAKIRGEGKPEPYICPKCQKTIFRVFIQFDYCDACEDLLEDEPDIEIENYFTNILISGKCVNCKEIATVLDMDL